MTAWTRAHLSRRANDKRPQDFSGRERVNGNEGNVDEGIRDRTALEFEGHIFYSHYITTRRRISASAARFILDDMNVLHIEP